jgi:hypothetical protein
MRTVWYPAKYLFHKLTNSWSLRVRVLYENFFLLENVLHSHYKTQLVLLLYGFVSKSSVKEHTLAHFTNYLLLDSDKPCK